MGEAKRRKQQLGTEYGRPVAERASQYVRQVPVRREVGTRLITDQDGHNCVEQAAFAIAMGRHQWAADPDAALAFYGCDPRDLVTQVGQLLAYDHNTGGWDLWFEQGHCWIFDTGSDTLIELNSHTWEPALRRTRFRLADGVLEAPVVGIGTPELLPLLNRLEGVESINGCSLVYVPGVHVLDLVRAVGRPDPQHLRYLTAVAEQLPCWRRWCVQTAEHGHCTDDILSSSREWLADLGIPTAA